MNTANSIKPAKLYQIRHHANGGLRYGRAVGHKARLLPRSAALRIAKRLRKSGLFVTCDPIVVNTTKEQREYLAVRYA